MNRYTAHEWVQLLSRAGPSSLRELTPREYMLSAQQQEELTVEMAGYISRNSMASYRSLVAYVYWQLENLELSELLGYQETD